MSKINFSLSRAEHEKRFYNIRASMISALKICHFNGYPHSIHIDGKLPFFLKAKTIHIFYSVVHYMSHVTRKLDACQCKKQAQISCEVTAQLISAFVFSTCTCTIPCLHKFEMSSFSPFSVIVQAIVSDLVGNTKDQFSRVAAHIIKLTLKQHH